MLTLVRTYLTHNTLLSSPSKERVQPTHSFPTRPTSFSAVNPIMGVDHLGVQLYANMYESTYTWAYNSPQGQKKDKEACRNPCCAMEASLNKYICMPAHKHT